MLDLGEGEVWVVAFDRETRRAQLSSGEIITATNFIDVDREETDDSALAVSIVGPLANGNWFAGWVDDASDQVLTQ
jgi:hypothetical protein